MIIKKEKRSYATEIEAREHLIHIVESNHKPWKTQGNVKPNRIYQDPKDMLWYLTSKIKTW